MVLRLLHGELVQMLRVPMVRVVNGTARLAMNMGMGMGMGTGPGMAMGVDVGRRIGFEGHGSS